MSISSTSSATQAAIAAAQGDGADVVNNVVLRKALDLEGASAVALLQALPQPALATQGSIGTQLNAFA